MSCADAGEFSQRIREHCLAEYLGCHPRSRHGNTSLDKPIAVSIVAVPTADDRDGIEAAGATKHGVCDLLIAIETTQRVPVVCCQTEKFATALRRFMLPHARREEPYALIGLVRTCTGDWGNWNSYRDH